MRFLLFACILFWRFPGYCDDKTAPCGRDLESPVWYEVVPSDGVPLPDYTALVRVDPLGQTSSILIRAIRRSSGYDWNWRSTDGGRTWEMLFHPTDEPSNLDSAFGHVVQAPSQPAVVYKCLQDIGLYLRSEDHGVTWRLPSHRVGGEPWDEFAARLSGRSYYRLQFMITAIHPRQPLTLYAHIRAVAWANPITPVSGMQDLVVPGMYVSRNGGEDWTAFTDALEPWGRFSDALRPLGISPVDPNLMFGQSPQGLVRSEDGGKHWEPVGEQALLNTPARSITEKMYGMKLQGGRLGYGIEARQFVMDPTDRGILYVVANKGVYRTLDGGQHWRLLDLGFDMVDGYNNAALNPADPKELFVATQDGLFRSRDRGCHFEKIYPPAKAATRSSASKGVHQRQGGRG
jgi:photosystem II stability/assembly factor-like uncharacterized protein